MALRFKPVDNVFYELLQRSATQLVEGAAILPELLGEGADRAAIADRMRDAEHNADEITHEIARRVNTTFVTPFDREDIYSLGLRARRRHGLHGGGRRPDRPLRGRTGCPPSWPSRSTYSSAVRS